jgi:hypothetical protein
MQLRNQNPSSDHLGWSVEEIRTAFLFWLCWAAYVCLSAVLIAALLTDWPDFLHEQTYFR